MHPQHAFTLLFTLLFGASISNAYIIPPTATASPMPSKNYTLGFPIQTNGEVSDFVRRAVAVREVGEDGSGADGM